MRRDPADDRPRLLRLLSRGPLGHRPGDPLGHRPGGAAHIRYLVITPRPLGHRPGGAAHLTPTLPGQYSQPQPAFNPHPDPTPRRGSRPSTLTLTLPLGAAHSLPG
eukprot:scaffold94487_cov20-Phaeocystis_antarctica.AAC.1